MVGGEPAARMIVSYGRLGCDRRHDVSIAIDRNGAVGRRRGVRTGLERLNDDHAATTARWGCAGLSIASAVLSAGCHFVGCTGVATAISSQVGTCCPLPMPDPARRPANCRARSAPVGDTARSQKLWIASNRSKSRDAHVGASISVTHLSVLLDLVGSRDAAPDPSPVPEAT